MASLTALLHLMLRTNATRGRILGLSFVGMVGALLGLAVGLSEFSTTADGAELVSVYGLAVIVPVTTLVFATAALGDFREDETLVYLWLRPVGRTTIAEAAVLSAVTTALPITLASVALTAALATRDADVVMASVAATAVGVLAYSGLFVALGLQIRRSLVAGLAYILIWEGFIAGVGGGPAYLSIRFYTRTMLAEVSHVPLERTGDSLAVTLIVPLVVAALGLGYTTWRLRRQDIE